MRGLETHNFVPEEAADFQAPLHNIESKNPDQPKQRATESGRHRNGAEEYRSSSAQTRRTGEKRYDYKPEAERIAERRKYWKKTAQLLKSIVPSGNACQDLEAFLKAMQKSSRAQLWGDYRKAYEDRNQERILDYFREMLALSLPLEESMKSEPPFYEYLKAKENVIQEIIKAGERAQGDGHSGKHRRGRSRDAN